MGSGMVVWPDFPRFFAASVFSFPAALVNTFVCSAARYAVASPNPPVHARLLRSGVPSNRHGSFCFHDIAFIKLEMLGHFEVTIAPSHRDICRGMERGSRGCNFKQRAVYGGLLLWFIELEGKRPAACLLRGICVDQVEHPWRRIVIGKFLERPAMNARRPRLEISTRYRSLSITNERSSTAP